MLHLVCYSVHLVLRCTLDVASRRTELTASLIKTLKNAGVAQCTGEVKRKLRRTAAIQAGREALRSSMGIGGHACVCHTPAQLSSIAYVCTTHLRSVMMRSNTAAK